MPFDLVGLIESIQHGVAKLPSAVIAAILLGGPTAIWLITRFVNPPDIIKPVEIPVEDRLWLCASCLSINEDRHDHCYRCQRVRAAESMPVVIHGGREGSPRIGVAVGPGMADPALPAPGWLGGEFIVTQLPTKSRRQPEPAAPEPAAPEPALPRPAVPEPVTRHEPVTRIEPAAVTTLEPAQATADDDLPAPVEPRILKPRVKVSTRASASKGTGRRGRQPQGAGEAN